MSLSFVVCYSLQSIMTKFCRHCVATTFLPRSFHCKPVPFASCAGSVCKNAPWWHVRCQHPCSQWNTSEYEGLSFPSVGEPLFWMVLGHWGICVYIYNGSHGMSQVRFCQAHSPSVPSISCSVSCATMHCRPNDIAFFCPVLSFCLSLAVGSKGK